MKTEAHQYHRRSNLQGRGYRPRCKKSMNLRYHDIYPEYSLSFNMICKKCLSTFTKQEIKEFKFWLIVRKLKG